MPQKTNLNISPYYDDFDKADNFYKVLFKPGFPVQARELSGLQSILQNQVEQFGNHIFKEGSMVIPGSVTYDNTYFACKVNADHLGVDVSIYLDAIIQGEGTRVRGQNSQIVGKIINYILPPAEGVDEITIFVKYTESSSTGASEHFPNGEILVLDENVTYGNTTLKSGDTVLTLVADDATATGSSFGVDSGVYFLRGSFVDVPKSLIVLEPYSNKPTYRVGFEIIEEIINASDDPSLNDNAKGFTNFAAPGADRFKISVKLSKKSIDDFDDINFVELLRVRKGEIKKIQNSSIYSEIKKYLAKRTFDESGNYSVNPFRVNLQNSLNDEIGSNGLYLDSEKTDQGADPSDDLMCVKLSPGKAYVRGFDVALPGTTVLDVEKPRDTKTIKSGSVPFRMGSLLRVNHSEGTPYINIGQNDAATPLSNVVELWNSRKGSGAAPTAGNGLPVGKARVYWYNPSDAPYTGDSTEWDLYMYDVQTYTVLQISNTVDIDFQKDILAPLGSKVTGQSSGATGYVDKHRNGGEIHVIQTTGSFVKGEKIIFNERTSNVGVDTCTANISNVITYSTDDIRSVFQSKDIGGFQVDFSADSVLYDKVLPNFSLTDQLNVSSGGDYTYNSYLGASDEPRWSEQTAANNYNETVSYGTASPTGPAGTSLANIFDGDAATFTNMSAGHADASLLWLTHLTLSDVVKVTVGFDGDGAIGYDSVALTAMNLIKVSDGTAYGTPGITGSATELILYDGTATNTPMNSGQLTRLGFYDFTNASGSAGDPNQVKGASAVCHVYYIKVQRLSDNVLTEITWDTTSGPITENLATCPRRRFSGQVGIKTDSIIGYQKSSSISETYNRISNISANGEELTLKNVATISGVNDGTLVSGNNQSTFRIKVPKIINLNRSGLFSKLPKKNISTVDLSDSNLTITRQVKGKNPDSTFRITLQTSELFDGSGNDGALGITTAFFEPFDAERYSIHYKNGVSEELTQDKVNISNNGATVVFSGLKYSSADTAAIPATINCTLKKLGLATKQKNYIRSSTLAVTKTISVSNESTNLGISSAYGLRVEDKEISLNIPDVVKVHAVYESKDKIAPTLDQLKFVSGLGLLTNSFIGEQVVGSDSRAIGQIVNRVDDENIEFVYLNANKFVKGETIEFKESNINSVCQKVTEGNYVDRTSNFTLDKGHRKQFCDYSRIVRKASSAKPSKRLLVIFDYYESAENSNGDFYTVNSYNKERYTHDLPVIGNNRASDILDFRPRVKKFVPNDTAGQQTTSSPFSYNSRLLETDTRYVVTPDESTIVGYSYYLPRIDKLVINKFEEVKLIKGVSDDKPAPPTELGDSMEVAQISLPPYLYDPMKGPAIRLYDNRRFTMRDIGKLEKRIDNLEVMTSLTSLELDTKSLAVKDADGLDRFKTGFIVNDFKNRDFISFAEDGSRCDVDVVNKELISAVDFWSMRAQLGLNPGIDYETADMSSNLSLLDPNCQKTGDLVTLKYDEVQWIHQPQASGVENINPFNVIVYVGGVILDPPSDNWTRTIYIDNHRVESTGATWNEIANIVSDNTTSNTAVDVTETEIETDQDEFDGNHTDITTTTTTTHTQTVVTSFTNQMEGPSREFDYVESVKISGESDQFMRSRNVAFAANGLKPYTKHVHKLDSGVPDIVPKLIEIQMETVATGFNIGENVRVMNGSTQIGYLRSAAPSHKFGDATRPEVGSGLGSPNKTVEKYTVDPFDRSRPGPADSYSATSVLFNTDVYALANNENYWGYVIKGAKLVGETSGTEATITNTDLMSDQWGDVLGAFFFRDANATPTPSVLFYTGTKTFRLTANTTGAFVPTGSTALASDASGTYTGTGTILTQNTSTVGVRNPPPPAQKPNETTVSVTSNSESSTVRIEAPYRDPLAQTFTVDETGAFLTSFDVYFYKKDPNAKVFVELREVELGTPTSFLVQDYAQVALNPNNINTSDDATAATTIKFPSPVYLESGKEYAIVFLSPGSDEYEMWVATMGQKSVTPPVGLPATSDQSQFGVVTKQYIGGSLFKSQNGTIWTPSQYQDLKFTLRKASFVPFGTTTFYNSPIEPGNLNAQRLPSNPVRTLPRKIKFGVTQITKAEAVSIPVGRKISTGLITDSEDDSITGVIEERGAPIDTTGGSGSALKDYGVEVTITGSGFNKKDTSTGALVNSFTESSCSLKSITGSGTGAVATLTFVNGIITQIDSVSNAGSGYVVGEVLEVDVASTANILSGGAARIVITKITEDIDTLWLTDVQGEKFVINDNIIHYGSDNDTRTVLGNNAKVDVESTVVSEIYNGNVIEVIQYNHAHHGNNNKITVEDVEPDTTKVTITEDLAVDGTQVTVSDITPFQTFAGITSDRGEALIEGEVVQYIVQSTNPAILSLSSRGFGSSAALSHTDGTSIQTYEVNGMPLVDINATHDIPTTTALKDATNIDNYFLELDRGTGNRAGGKNQISFTSEKAVGGSTVGISQNHQFSNASAQCNVITPGKTRASAAFRTISGTSADGNEVSFIDQGFEPTILNETTFFPTPRMVASKVNEANRLDTLPKNKSLTLKVDMSTADANLSPVLDVKNATLILGRNKINNPIGVDNYDSDFRTNQISGDPHGSIFVSNRVNLKQPATSLKVFVSGNVRPEADFRVFYRLFTADSSEVSQTYRPFPGFKNLIDTNGDGYGDEIIDESKNDGRADAKVKANGTNDFSEYQFSIDNLEQFSGFTIKIVMTSTNECVPIRLKDFRAIALA